MATSSRMPSSSSTTNTCCGVCMTSLHCQWLVVSDEWLVAHTSRSAAPRTSNTSTHQLITLMYGQRDDKACAAISREVGCDGAAMQVDDLPADIQPQAHTGAVAARVGLVEAVEDVRAVLGRDAQPVIADRDLRHLPVLCRGDVDGPPIRAVLDGVAHEVDQHLLDA